MLGIDNVLFDVENLEPAVAFYERCGLRLRWCSNEKGIALFSIRSETPGFLIRRRGAREAGCLWVEVADAKNVTAMLEAEGIQTVRIETATGVTCEARDPSGNRIGFADYTRDRALGRRS